MEAAERLIERMQSLPEQAYRAHDDQLAATLPAQALDAGFRGLALGAPRSVDAAASPAVPALLVTAASGRRTQELPWPRNAIAVATDCHSGRVYAAPAFPVDDSKSPGPPPSDAPPAAARAPQYSPEEEAARELLGDGASAGTAWLDFRRLLDLPGDTGCAALRVIAFDQASNPVTVSLKAAPHAAPAAHAESGEHGHSEPAPANPWRPRLEAKPAGPLPGLHGHGAILALSAQKAKAGERHVVAHGSARLADYAAMFAGETRQPASVRAALLIAMRNRPEPILVPLALPLASLAADASLDFSVDLHRVLPSEAGDYRVYLLVGPYMSGPQALTLTAD